MDTVSNNPDEIGVTLSSIWRGSAVLDSTLGTHAYHSAIGPLVFVVVVVVNWTDRRMAEPGAPSPPATDNKHATGGDGRDGGDRTPSAARTHSYYYYNIYTTYVPTYNIRKPM